MNVDPPESRSDTRADSRTVMPCRVLFLDDEQPVLDGLARQLRDPPAPWRFDFCRDPEEALQRVLRIRYDIVVSDICMPVIRGDAWLKQVEAVSPDTVRIALSGKDDRATTLAALNTGHVFHFLSKPCLRGELLRVLDLARRQSQIDHAERDMLRMKLEHTERLETVGRFTAGIIHDLNNLLGVVLSASNPRSGFQSGEALEIVHTHARRMCELTNDLLAFCRDHGRRELQPIELAPVIESATRMLGPALARSAKLQVEIADQLPSVLGCPSELKQVLTNLVLNARDAMPGGGQICIRAELCPTLPSRTAGPNADEHALVCISVADHGCGMDEATKRRLFAPFYTTKEEGKGTGLGLAVVKQIVDRHHGHIHVDSIPGVGSTFRVFIPAMGQRDRDPIAAGADERGAGEGGKAS